MKLVLLKLNFNNFTLETNLKYAMNRFSRLKQVLIISPISLKKAARKFSNLAGQGYD